MAERHFSRAPGLARAITVNYNLKQNLLFGTPKSGWPGVITAIPRAPALPKRHYSFCAPLNGFQDEGPLFVGRLRRGYLCYGVQRNYFAFARARVPLCTSEVIIALCSVWRSFMGGGAQVNRFHSVDFAPTPPAFRTFKWGFQEDNKPPSALKAPRSLKFISADKVLS